MHIEEMELETTVCALLRVQLASESGLSIQQTVMCHHMIGTSSYNIVDSLYSSSPVMGHVTQDILVSY